MTAEGTRQSGVVGYVSLGPDDRGQNTFWLGIEFGSSSQGFGGIVLDESALKTFIREMCALFGVGDFQLIKGKTCTALRCWPDWNEPIEGIEVDGRRFTLTGFLRRTRPAKTTDRLSARRENLSRELQFARERVDAIRRQLETCSDGYVDWESQS